jgi:hypothetical protein
VEQSSHGMVEDRGGEPVLNPVDLEYDLFEKFPDGSVLWRDFVPGLDNAFARLQELAKLSPNEHFAIHTPSKAIVGRVNATNP